MVSALLRCPLSLTNEFVRIMAALTDSGHCTRFLSHQLLKAKAQSFEGYT